MKRFHVHVSVDDLNANIRFYSTVFGLPPTVLKDDYAKWMLDDPRINFAISKRGMKPGLDHLGVQVEVERRTDRAARPGAPGRDRCAGSGQRRLLLRALRQVLGHRPAGHRLGDVPHAGLGSGVWRGQSRVASRTGSLGLLYAGVEDSADRDQTRTTRACCD